MAMDLSKAADLMTKKTEEIRELDARIRDLELVKKTVMDDMIRAVKTLEGSVDELCRYRAWVRGEKVVLALLHPGSPEPVTVVLDSNGARG